MAARIFTQNLHLKTLSLAVTLVLFVLVAQQSEVVRSFTLDVEVREVPQGQVLLDSGLTVRLMLRGNSSAFQEMDEHALRTYVVPALAVGETSREIREDDFDLPPGLTIESIDPHELRFSLDEMVERELPIQANLDGSVPEGYQLLSQRVMPQTIRVEAPSRYFPELDRLYTETIPLHGIVGSVERPVSLTVTRPFVEYDPDTQIVVYLEVGVVEAERTIHGVQITPLGSARGGECVMLDSQMSLRVSGPKSIIDGLDASDVFATVNCAPFMAEGAGTYLVVPTLQNVPSALDVLERSPERARLRVVPTPETQIEGSGSAPDDPASPVLPE